MKNKFSRFFIVTSFVLWFLTLGISSIFITKVVAQEGESQDRFSQLKVFTDVISLVQKNYVEKVDFPKLVEGAVRGMLLTLDPHSGYLSADHFKELRVETSGEFGGLGIEITVQDGLLTVVSPIEGSPAIRAGVKAGDKIIKIEDEFARDLSVMEAVKKMRGPKGTPVTISVHREGKTGLIPLTVVRDIIRVKSVRSRMLGKDIGYIRLSQFQEGSSREFLEAYEKLGKESGDKEMRGLVVDLRNNPGGLLTEAVRVCDLFLEDGIIVYTDGRLESQKQKFFAHKDDDSIKLPTVVLINQGSASASEIFSGALQDHGKALILGTKSFGKGSVQTVLPMESGAALRLTTALYFTKSGRSIQAEGVTPDIVVAQKSTDDDVDAEAVPLSRRESDLPGAIKNPNSETKKDAKKSKNSKGKKSKAKTKADEEASKLRVGSRAAMKAELKELLKVDNQLAEALKLLKAWDVFKHILEEKPSVEEKIDLAA